MNKHLSTGKKLSTTLKDLSRLIFIWMIAVLIVASCSNESYAKDLSKLISVTPQRHCGFIVPNFCKASQAKQNTGASVTATPTRLQSLYEGMTRQNKSVMANMSGGSDKPRVNPLTSLFTGENLKNSKLSGGNHA